MVPAWHIRLRLRHSRAGKGFGIRHGFKNKWPRAMCLPVLHRFTSAVLPFTKLMRKTAPTANYFIEITDFLT
jgi:hypothetical protein